MRRRIALGVLLAMGPGGFSSLACSASAGAGARRPPDVPGESSVSPAPTTEPVMEVVTFNIRYGTAEDGEDSWVNRRELTMRVIRDLDADLIGLQEALNFQLEEIDAELPGYGRIGVGRDDADQAGEFSAIYYRAARFQVKDSGTFWFSDTPEVAGSTSGATPSRGFAPGDTS